MPEHAPELSDGMRALRYHKLVMFLIVAAFAAGAFAFAYAEPATYRATSKVVVQPVLQLSTSTSTIGGLGEPSLPADIETESEIAGSALVASAVLRHLPDGVLGSSQVPASPDELADSIATDAVTDDLLEITASAPTPELSALIANAVAEQYLARRTDAAARTRDALIHGLSGRIVRLERSVERLDRRIIETATRPVVAAPITQGAASSSASRSVSAAERKAELDQLREERDQSIVQLGTLRARYEDLLTIPAGSIGGGQVVQRAVPPEAPAFPQPIRIAAVALVIGAIVAVAVALLLERIQDRVRTRDDAAEAAGAPVLAAIVGRRRRRGRVQLAADTDPSGTEAQAFRTLRTKLVAHGLGSDVRSLLVAPVEGRTVDRVVAELAATVAAIGYRVLALSAFVRGSRLPAFFPDGFDAVPHQVGLASVLSGETRWADAVVRTGRQNLLVLRSGPLMSWTPDLLGSIQFARLIGEAESTADVLLIESPSVAAGSDATSVAIQADAALLVINAGADRRTSVARASAALRQTGCEPIGVLLMRCARKDRTVGVPSAELDWSVSASNGSHAGDNGNGKQPDRSDDIVAATGGPATRGEDA